VDHHQPAKYKANILNQITIKIRMASARRSAQEPYDVLPVPTLDERVTLYLRAVHGNREFTEEERSNARNALLDSMAAEIVASSARSYEAAASTSI
jgi:hypothetical protein